MSTEQSLQRVLQVHTHYLQSGGEDFVVEAERSLLEAAGVRVRQVIFDNSQLTELHSSAGRIRAARDAIWNRPAERRVERAVAHFRPQVVHVHNTFAVASPSIYRSARGARLVQTLHNYRFVCPAATAFRDNHPCTDCVGRAVPWPAIVHACVRGSRPQSLVMGASLVLHRAARTFDAIDRYLALTSFQASMMVAGGLPSERVRIVPNFLEPDPGVREGPRAGVLFVGRLSEEKGIVELLSAAERLPGVVSIAGEGPLEPMVRASAARDRVSYLGRLDRGGVLEAVRSAIALVLPSRWFEGFPIVALEALATGTPVLASEIGSLSDIVQDGVNGRLVRQDDHEHLGRMIEWVVTHPMEMSGMGQMGRRQYVTRYSGPAHLAGLLAAYGGEFSIADSKRG